MATKEPTKGTETTKPKPPGHPVGVPPEWSPADIARLSEVTEEDVASAAAEFERLAPPAVKPLLRRKGKRRKTT